MAPKKPSLLKRATGPADAATTIESWLRQRAVARRLQDIMDLFCEHLSRGEPGARFVSPAESATTGAEVVRNLTRTFALGCAVRLGLDLGLFTTELFGKGERGRTEILDLACFHGGSVARALENFDALRQDRGEFGRMVAERYAVLLKSAQAEVKSEEKKRKAGEFAPAPKSAA